MTAYEPGTVAVATVRGVPNVRVMRTDNHAATGAEWFSGDLIDDYRYHNARHLTNVHPLVVIDPDTVPDLRGYLPEMSGDYDGDDHRLVAVIDQIEAQTRPPKPAEPTGLGAVVEDAEGRRFIRYGASLAPWIGCADNEGIDPDRPYRYWSGIDAVRVLSEGVPA